MASTGQTATPTERIVSCGDVSCEFLVDPIPRPTLDPITVNLKPRKREVVLVDTSKPNSMAILQHTQTLLREAGIPVQDTIRIPRATAAVAFDAAEVDEYAAEDGLIVYGIND